MIVAVNAATNEVKYFLSNAVECNPTTLLRVAFRRSVVEQLFRIGKQEVGLTHFEGRHYRGLMRHLTMALIVMGFASQHAARLSKKR